MKPTSRLPWAGALALAFVFAADRGVFSSVAVVSRLREELPALANVERGVLSDRFQRLRAQALDAATPRVFVMGSSRAAAGIRTNAVTAARDADAVFVRLAHARVQALELATLYREMSDLGPSWVWIVISELDTHRALRLVPQATGAGVGALVDLVASAGARFAIEHRRDLLRIVLVAGLDAYRYRDALHAAGANRMRRFPLDVERYPQAPRASWPDVLPVTFEPAGPPHVSHELSALFPEIRTEQLADEIRQLRSVGEGPGAAARRALLTATVERALVDGARVLIIEAPIHAQARAIVGDDKRADFLAFARGLAERPGVHLLALEDLPAFEHEHFLDLTHLDETGGLELTRAVVEHWLALAP